MGEKMGTYSNRKSHKVQGEMNRNPVTNKFSTYYQRKESVGGLLLETADIAKKYICDKKEVQNEQKNININIEHEDMEEDDINIEHEDMGMTTRTTMIRTLTL